EMFERFILHSLPRPGHRKDKAPAAGRIGGITGFDHGHIGLGTIGGIPTHDHQLGPTWWNKRAYHRAKQGIFTAILRVALGQNQSKVYRYTIAVPGRRSEEHTSELQSLAY